VDDGFFPVGSFGVRLGVTLACLLLALGLTGCHWPTDPTDSSRFNDVTLTNDTNRDAVLLQCDVTCAETHDVLKVPRSKSLQVSISNENVPTGFVVQDSNGRDIGCLTLLYTHKEDRIRTMLSKMTAAPRQRCPQGS
jgi:hypothetical protein